MKNQKRKPEKLGIREKPIVAKWLEDKPSKADYKRVVKNYNTLKGYERLPMPNDSRTEKEKYHSHMVIVVRKDEIPNFSKMNAEAIRSWCEENNASPYLRRRNYEALKSLLWALRRWKNVKAN